MGKSRAGKNITGAQFNAFHIQRDNFFSSTRLNLYLEAVASENLRGVVGFEIGEIASGNASWSSGGALGGDSPSIIKVQRAYLEWTVPNSTLKLRMGLQGVALPYAAFANPVLDTDGAGITASYVFNDNVALTAMWLRPFNDNWGGLGASSSSAQAGGLNSYSPANYMDNFDLFALIVPLSYEGVKVTPWVMGGAYGPNVQRPSAGPVSGLPPMVSNPPYGDFIMADNTITFGNTSFQIGDSLFYRAGMLPAALSSSRSRERVFDRGYTNMFWGGLNGSITSYDPWRFAADFIYGTAASDAGYLTRSGWWGTLLAEYKAAWGKPGVYAYYSSGDDSDVNNGSERLPYICVAGNYFDTISSFGYRGTSALSTGKGVLGTPDGVWGVGGRIKDISFMDKVKHTLLLNYFGGTNDTKMASYITGRQTTDSQGRPVYRNYTDYNSPLGVYMTTADSGIEVNFDTRWQAYDNLALVFEVGYIHLWMDEGVWGKYGASPSSSLNVSDAWKFSLNFMYSF